MSDSRFYGLPVSTSSNDDTWTTPVDFYNKVNKEFNFVLDAAALESSALCDKWYGPDHTDLNRRDAFNCDWTEDANGGNIWLNPPYGKTIGEWVAKAKLEALKGKSKIVCLIPARTDTSWFHDSCIEFEIRFIKGRLRFGGNGRAPFPSALVIMEK